MQDAPGSRGVVEARRPRARYAGVGALACALAMAISSAACGLKGPLALPEKSRNVVIRPGPGEAGPAPVPAPEVEPLPPPELPPDSRGNTRG